MGETERVGVTLQEIYILNTYSFSWLKKKYNNRHQQMIEILPHHQESACSLTSSKSHCKWLTLETQRLKKILH